MSEIGVNRTGRLTSAELDMFRDARPESIFWFHRRAVADIDWYRQVLHTIARCCGPIETQSEALEAIYELAIEGLTSGLTFETDGQEAVGD